MTSANFIEYLLATSDENEPRSYSGRAMFGASCVAIVTNSIEELVATVMYEVTKELDDITDEDDDGRMLVHNKAKRLIRIFRTTRSDDYGLERIYYWPSMIWPKENYDNDEE